MRKPQDPRHHGLLEPKSVYTNSTTLYISDMEVDGKVPLRAVVAAWDKTVKDHEGQGHRIKEGPYFNPGGYYGKSISLSYSYEWENLIYPAEKADYDNVIAKYEADLAKFQAYEAELKLKPLNLDQKIERAKQRLANLEAAKAGKEIPYPEG